MKKLLTIIILLWLSLTAGAQQLNITSPDSLPDPLAFCPGETITFTLDYDGWGSAIWYASPVEPDLEGESNADLWETLSPLGDEYTHTLEQEVYIWVMISEGLSSSYTNVHHLMLNGEKPELVYADTEFCSGSSLDISCSVTGLGEGNYQWLKDGVIIENATSETLSITEPGEYKVGAMVNETDCPGIYYYSETVNFSYIKPEITGEYIPDMYRVTLSTGSEYVSYQWYEAPTMDGPLNPVDGENAHTFQATVTGEDKYYVVEIETNSGCTVMSDRVLINDSLYSEPVIDTADSIFLCEDGTAVLSLKNQGYSSYQWYKNENPIFNANGPEYEVSSGGFGGSGVYSVKVMTQLDTVNEFESNSIDITFAKKPAIDVADDAVLCPGTTVSLVAKQSNTGFDGKYDTYQWYINTENDFSSAVEIPDANQDTLEIEVPAERRYYWLSTTINGCENISNSAIIQEYEVYMPPINHIPFDTKVCMGDTVELKVNTEDDCQWYRDDQPIDGATGQTYYATEPGYYDIEVTSTICEDAAPRMSEDSIVVDYKVKPDYIVEPDGEYYQGDSSHIIFCNGTDVSLALENATNYDSIQWMGKLYNPSSSSDEWEALEGENNDSFDFTMGNVPKVHFKVRVDSIKGNGEVCSGMSDYKTVDAWAFASPVIASYNFSELCEEGDSTLMHLAYNGDWARIEWYRDGQLVPNSDNDTLYAKKEGTYMVICYPTKCPQHGYGNGVGVTVSFMPKAEINEEEDYIYAMPQGHPEQYDYQWFLDGEPLDMSNFETPWKIDKANLHEGEYTVEVENVKGCVRLSESYSMLTLGQLSTNIQVVPNPVNDILNINLDNPVSVKKIEIFYSTGHSVETIMNPRSKETVDFSQKNSGLYVLKITYNDGSSESIKVVK